MPPTYPQLHRQNPLLGQERGLLTNLPPRGEKEAESDRKDKVAPQVYQKQTGVYMGMRMGVGSLVGKLILKHQVLLKGKR